ncbi:hypothetical protein Pint_28878 [Pistacia integerrima]|uniref:Uncharacterized protein n=1 Tax=Pistacia integerrima TaxID=434235 RepID=A0ACC0X0W1_9ROSI|nr:hypothetical protein Pint_28878 [Pistacia integerrima]
MTNSLIKKRHTSPLLVIRFSNLERVWNFLRSSIYLKYHSVSISNFEKKQRVVLFDRVKSSSKENDIMSPS